MGLDDAELIRVLHVDDEPDFSAVTAEFLERENEQFAVDTAKSAAAGLDRLAEDAYDCIVSDYEMPGCTGVEFLRTVREEYPEQPFILYTGRGSEAVASEAISAGVTDYLQKETGTEQYAVLANRIENAVGRQRTERELERTREYFGTILAHASDFVLIVDETGTVDYASPAVERALGYDPDEIEGTSAFEFVHPEDVTRATDTLEGLLDASGAEREIEFRARHADDTWQWLETRGRNLLEDPVVDGVIINARAITDRKEREQALLALHDATSEFAAARSVVDASEQVVTAMVDIAGLPNGTVFRYDENSGVLQPVAQCLDDDQPVDALPAVEPGEGVVWEAFTAGETVHREDARGTAAGSRLGTAVRSELIVPLGEHGVIVAVDPEPAAFDGRDRELAEIVAAAAETALDSVAQTERLRKQMVELDE